MIVNIEIAIELYNNNNIRNKILTAGKEAVSVLIQTRAMEIDKDPHNMVGSCFPGF